MIISTVSWQVSKYHLIVLVPYNWEKFKLAEM